ncbi:MAG: phosphogluconate dehydratase [Methyloligellaceae bacterium]
MPLHDRIAKVTRNIAERSVKSRRDYMDGIKRQQDFSVRRGHLSCGNIAHVCAASMSSDKNALATGQGPNLGIITSFNDMLSAHQPFEKFPDIIKEAARSAGGIAQVAAGVPAMCDGITQGQPGMELSLFSRDVIAMSAAVGLSHNCFDAVVYLGVCDKIVPGLVIAAATFGHLPAVFLPGGPMPSGLPNDEKARVRQKYAAGEIGREELLAAEMKSYHSPGTCTFYGTANTNQMLMEVMGLHLPGASFVNPDTELREKLTIAGAKRAMEITALKGNYIPACDVLTEKAFVNGIVGLLATGGSTNLVLHLVAMARAAGIIIDLEDFSELSSAVPLMARVYPNGVADVNHFQAAGGLQLLISELLDAGLLHKDVQTIAGFGLQWYCQEPVLDGEDIHWRDCPKESLDRDVLRGYSDSFQKTGGLIMLNGNLGRSVIKTSAVKSESHIIEAPAIVFEDQEEVKLAFKAGELERDMICVVRFQGPKANGMPELHSLMPLLGTLQDRGFKVALVTDGRMSGASGKVPAAIHVSPEAASGGPIAKVQSGDVIRLDAVSGELSVLSSEFASRVPVEKDLSQNQSGLGRELFGLFRSAVGAAENGAGVFGERS